MQIQTLLHKYKHSPAQIQALTYMDKHSHKPITSTHMKHSPINDWDAVNSGGGALAELACRARRERVE